MKIPVHSQRDGTTIYKLFISAPLCLFARFHLGSYVNMMKQKLLDYWKFLGESPSGNDLLPKDITSPFRNLIRPSTMKI